MVSILDYSSEEGKQKVKAILNRSRLEKRDTQAVVDEILADVRQNGDEALFKYTLKFDGFNVTPQNIRVTSDEIKRAYDEVEPRLVEILKKSAERIADFHRKQKLNSWLEPSENGEMLGQLIRPIETAGMYVPGGKAAYPSSVLMNIVTAKVAGVKRIIMCTPADKNGKVYPQTLVAADIAGADEIYKVGGAQAIGAMAFGAQSVPKTDKICGPGNIYVALAKRAVYGYVSIDSVAGPSEILVLADKSARPDYVAADMLSQAEHDQMASAILVTDSEELARNVKKQIEAQIETLPRKDIIKASLENYGAVILVENTDKGCELANLIAPEHMEICAENPFSYLPKIKNAGAIFLGEYSPEALGDYMAGPNHVLPTGGTARFFSPLSVDDFVKKSSVISFSQSALLSLQSELVDFANAEGLTAHANAVRIREAKQ